MDRPVDAVDRTLFTQREGLTGCDATRELSTEICGNSLKVTYITLPSSRPRLPCRRTSCTHHPPQLPSRPPSTHTPWSGRGPGRQGGAPNWTNDLDALGRVCSALPGSMADGMGAPHARPYGPAAGSGAPAIPVPADPPPEASGSDRAVRTVLGSWPPGPIHLWAGVGAARAERAEGRSVARSGAGKPARRSGAQPGLDEVEKPVTTPGRLGSWR